MWKFLPSWPLTRARPVTLYACRVMRPFLSLSVRFSWRPSCEIKDLKVFIEKLKHLIIKMRLIHVMKYLIKRLLYSTYDIYTSDKECRSRYCWVENLEKREVKDYNKFWHFFAMIWMKKYLCLNVYLICEQTILTIKRKALYNSSSQILQSFCSESGMKGFVISVKPRKI